MPDYQNSQPGWFLTYDIWFQAVRLLRFQLEQKQRNRHFNTLSMFHYERLGETTSYVESQEYFAQRVASGLFYGLENEFAIYPYPVPKSRLGLRDYKFLTYPMRVLYYSICLYIAKISEAVLENYRRERPNISSYYGGDIRFQDGELILKSKSVYYLLHYKAFRRKVRRLVKGDNVFRRLVMRLT